MLEDLKLLLGLEDTDKKTEQQLQLILECHETAVEILLAVWSRRKKWNTSYWMFQSFDSTESDQKGSPLTVLRARAFPGLKMILPDTWMMFSLIWTANGRQGRER